MEEKNLISVKEIEKGEKIPFRRTKMRVPYKSEGSEDWDKAEIVEIIYE